MFTPTAHAIGVSTIATKSKQKLTEGEWLCRRLHTALRQRVHSDVHTRAGCPGIDQKQTNDERDGRYYFKVNDRFNYDATDLPRFANACDSVHDSAEDDWSY